MAVRNKMGRRPAGMALLLLSGAALLVLSGCAAWRIGQSVELARRSEPFQQRPASAALRLLVVGDSTAVGTGATSANTSLAGLIGSEHPRLWIENRAQDGAKFADVLRQLSGPERFDLVLVQAGGNDVIRMRDMDLLREDITRVLDAAAERAPLVLLMPAGNVGNAPFFFAPLSWLMTQRARQMQALVAEIAQQRGALHIKLFHERADDPFVGDPSLHARDGLHPSDAGYRSWWLALRTQAGLDAKLASARAP